MHRDNRLLIAIAAFALLAASATGCSRPEDAAPAATDESTALAPADEAAAGPPDPCTFTRGTLLIDGMRLESDDGACRLYLPGAPTAGSLTVRVSRAGDEGAAAVERDGDEGTLYATTGTVTIESADDGHLVGRVDARDETPPGTGLLSGSFDVRIDATP